jgi:hypothetical protein
MPADIDLRVDIAPDADPDGASSAWTWRDVSAYRRQAADVELNTGRDDEASDVEAGDSNFVANLRDGLLSPRNPVSELYGRIGVNTPIRYRLPIARDDFSNRTIAANGGWGTSSGGQTWNGMVGYSVQSGVGRATLAAANSAILTELTGVAALDSEVVYSVACDAVTTGAPWISILQVRKVDNNAHYRVYTELKSAGVVTIKIVKSLNGTNTTLIENLTTAATYSAGSKVWTKTRVQGNTLRAKVWSGLVTAEPATWDVAVNNADIEGAAFAMYQWRFVGNTNVGALSVSIDDFSIDALLWTGNVPEWPPTWDKSGQDSTIPLVAAGPMRRLDVGREPLQSPLRRQLPSYGPSGYWPFEDAEGSATAASALPRGHAAQVKGVTFAADSDNLLGASTMAKLDATNSSVIMQVTADSTTSIQCLGFFKFAALPAADTCLVEYRTGGTIARWRIIANNLGFYVEGYNGDGTKLVDSVLAVYVIDPRKVFSISFQASQSGGNITWAIVWNQVGVDTWWTIGNTVAGTSGRINEARLIGATALVDMLFGHFWLGPQVLPYVTDSFLLVADGYRNEEAADRIVRLANEEGVVMANKPTTISEPMGRQLPGRFLDLLREAAKVDGGVLAERAGGLTYIPRTVQYNAPVAMVLDWAGGDLGEAPKPTDDDQRLRNRWTVSRIGGSSATYQNDESVARHGAMPDSTDINIVADYRLANWASWQTALTSLDELRWPVIELDLVGNPGLRTQFLACRIGSRIQIVNPKAQIAGTVIDLFIEGIKQKIGRHCWDVTLACSPADVYRVATWAEDRSRYDAKTTTLAEGMTLTETLWDITTVRRRDIWSRNTPYTWKVGGEVVTVTAMTAATGTGPFLQTATVTRSVNGIVKTHAIGEPVHLATPVRWAL